MNSLSKLEIFFSNWLSKFEKAIDLHELNNLSMLLETDSDWRDLLAFTGTVTTVSNSDLISQKLIHSLSSIKAFNFEIDTKFTPPIEVLRAGEKYIEGFFKFETTQAFCNGVLRFKISSFQNNEIRAATLFTCIDQLKTHPETINKLRPHGNSYSRDFTGPNWLDNRIKDAAYLDRDPEVLIVGMGHAGLSTAARLNQIGIDTLVIDRQKRVGDNWRKRYHALTLHNQVHTNHLPYMLFPPNWPKYIPKDKLGNWFEAYAESMEINHWLETELIQAKYDKDNSVWIVQVKQSGEQIRHINVKHIVMATGASDVPNLPVIPGLDKFKGEVIHSSKYSNPGLWKDKRVGVFGTGTSGHDISQDLYSNGVAVSLIQRSPTLVLNIEPSGQLPYELYGEERTLEECDLIVTSTPLKLLEKAHKILAQRARDLDKDLIRRLEDVGFQINHTYDKGWQFLYLERGGGYYFNVGCSELIAEKKIPLISFNDIESFYSKGVTLKNKSQLEFDSIVLATGYKGQKYSVEKYFGKEISETIGEVWGFDNERQELNNMWCETKQPGLWFIAGSFAQCRIYSKYLALQIKNSLLVKSHN
jgi:cation diffusion facilitator CzcD-associated flavoprotein CzcO